MRLAKQRGVSEAQVIRQTLEREIDAPVPGGENAFENMLAFANKRNVKFADQAE